MLKRSMILLLVIAMLVSFSAAVIAEEDGKAPNNEAGVEILVEENDETVIKFLDAVPKDAKNNPSDKGPSNPITVAGK